jgi:hypothetical protein
VGEADRLRDDSAERGRGACPTARGASAPLSGDRFNVRGRSHNPRTAPDEQSCADNELSRRGARYRHFGAWFCPGVWSSSFPSRQVTDGSAASNR